MQKIKDVIEWGLAYTLAVGMILGIMITLSSLESIVDLLL